jgi:hypothetical protein
MASGAARKLPAHESDALWTVSRTKAVNWLPSRSLVALGTPQCRWQANACTSVDEPAVQKVNMT